jgi:oxygen-independent coproporphyrinogen-3 oxidase
MKARYLKALKSEIRLRTEGCAFSSIYLGGGTPSLLSPDELKGLLEGLQLHAGAEVTIESNPEDVTSEAMDWWRDLGINRISVGIQSMSEDELTALDRRRSLQESCRALELLSVGWKNWSVDLIAGMGGQTAATLRSTLEAVFAGRPPHLSLYALETKPECRIHPQDPDVVADLLCGAWKHLRTCGYRHYEISNFCLPEYECQHNLGYWKREEYIGCGASAHSFLGGVRSWNTADVGSYIDRIDGRGETVDGREVLSEGQAAWEALLLALRLDAGVLEAHAVFQNPTEMEMQGWVSCSGGRVALTEKGMLVFNEIALRMAPSGSEK